MAVVTITGMTAVTTAKLTGAAVVEVEDSDVASRKATLAQIRTQMFAGGTGYTAADPLVVGTATLSGALTYGGVTLSNAVTGTGNMVLSASPTFTGTISAAALTASGTATLGGDVVLSAASGLIRRDTSDAADDGSIVIVGGGANSSARGGRVAVFGNESAGPGYVQIIAGNVSGAEIQLTMNGVGDGLVIDRNLLATFGAGIAATTGTFSTSVKTGSGSTAIPNATNTTIFALPGEGHFLVTAWDAGGSGDWVSANVYYLASGAVATAIAISNSSGETMDVSGGNVRVSQNSGSQKTYNWHYLRIAT